MLRQWSSLIRACGCTPLDVRVAETRRPRDAAVQSPKAVLAGSPVQAGLGGEAPSSRRKFDKHTSTRSDICGAGTHENSRQWAAREDASQAQSAAYATGPSMCEDVRADRHEKECRGRVGCTIPPDDR